MARTVILYQSPLTLTLGFPWGPNSDSHALLERSGSMGSVVLREDFDGRCQRKNYEAANWVGVGGWDGQIDQPISLV